MIFHYAGKYSGNPDDLPHLEHEPGAVAFKEAPDSKSLGRLANTISIILLIVFYAIICLRAHALVFNIVGVIIYMLSLVPHELIHAMCFKGDVYMFQNLKDGMLFVASPERMSKAKFIFMCMLPSIILALIPFIIYMIRPEFTALGMMAVFGIGSGAGDYYNVYNALTQVPRGGWVYGHKFNTYWYMPKK